jgi:tetratricopeptide (TPR) repeat protein
METALALVGKRYEAYPRSLTAKRQYSAALQLANQPRAAQQILRRLDPELDPPGRWSHEQARAGYSWLLAASHHTLGHYLEEVEITDRWRDSSNSVWWTIRGRALAALGREREVFELFRSLTGESVNTMADPSLTMATELAVHGNPRVGKALAESILVRVEAESGPPSYVAWANRLLGRKDQERLALEQVVRSDPDSLALLEAKGRIAVLDADTAEAELIDGILAVESARPLSTPTTRAAQIIVRAHIAAGFGRRERAVALLREASARGIVDLGPSFAYHTDLLLLPLRGYPPFEALLKPDN